MRKPIPNYQGSLGDYKDSMKNTLAPGEPDPTGMSTAAYAYAKNKFDREQKNNKEVVKTLKDKGMRTYAVSSEYNEGVLGFGDMRSAALVKQESPRRVQQAIKPEAISVVKKIRPLSKDSVKIKKIK